MIRLIFYYFNPLIPRREIHDEEEMDLSVYKISIHSSREGRYSNTAQKNGYHILTVLLKIQRFFLSAAPKTLKVPRTGRENASYPGANPPHFLCELPVRTMIIFAIHNHLLRSYHITSSDFMYLLYQNGDNRIFLHVKIRRSLLRLIFFVDFLFIISPRLQCNFHLK